jgi:hypothetical protein
MPARRLCLALAVCALLLATGQRARAGIYNVQSILATDADEGLSGAIVGSADWRTGNVSYLFLSASPVARYRSGKHLIIGIARGEHKTSRGDTLISRTLEHLRYRYQLGEHVLVESFAQHTFDAVHRLELRGLVGAGPKVDLVDGDDHGLGVGVAYMLEYERLQNDAELDAGQNDLAHRMSSYLVAHYDLDDRVQIVGSTYYQPRLTAFGDARFLGESQLTFKITTRLSFTTALSIAYDSRPPATIDELDTALTSSFSLEL